MEMIINSLPKMKFINEFVFYLVAISFLGWQRLMSRRISSLTRCEAASSRNVER